MANDEHVAMLARGALAWNEWRAKQAEMPGLSQAELCVVATVPTHGSSARDTKITDEIWPRALARGAGLSSS
jgi:hypothetical protein